MIKPLPDLSQPAWDTPLVQLLIDSMSATARLDERICATVLTPAWTMRTSWSGYARALQAQGFAIEEIDIFSHQCGVPLPFREPLTTTGDPFAALPLWHARFAANRRLHWTDDLNIPFTPPEGWAGRPALLRALELQARRVRATDMPFIWLDLPLLLQRLGVTRALLPGLVAGDKALRLSPHDGGILPRYLRALLGGAKDGLAQLNSMERHRLRAADMIAGSFRPGKLAALAALLMHRPVISPTRLAADLAITLSGAGKLLQRAARLGLVTEVRKRHNWRLYLAPDLAERFGFRSPARGRPPSPPPATPALDSVLAAFDAEMAAFDRLFGALTEEPRPEAHE